MNDPRRLLEQFPRFQGCHHNETILPQLSAKMDSALSSRVDITNLQTDVSCDLTIG